MSTSRPQIKNVTAEDVASSLYYVHINTPEDELLFANSRESSPSSSPSSGSARSGHAIARKPLRQLPNSPPNLSKLAVPTAPNASNAAPSTGAGQPAVDSQGGLPPPPDQLAPSPIQRKPVAGPGVTVDTQVGPPQPPPHQVLPHEILNLPPRPDEIDTHPDYANPLAPALPIRPGNGPASPTFNKLFKPFTLTLIRRDPTSGQQWNVGKITSYQLEHPEFVPEGKRIPSPAINIQLETSGYSKFRGMPPPGAAIDLNEIRESLDMIRPGSSGMAPPVGTSPQRQRARPELNATRAPPVTGNVFERQVKMVYAPSWTASLKNAFRRRGSRDEDSGARPSFGHNRYGSNASANSFGELEGGDGQAITAPGHGLTPRGYMFVSPWDGKCQFRTGNGGRSLRVRHTLPNHGSQWNPLADGPGDMDGMEGGGGGLRRTGSRSPKARGHDISELRFNLPSSELLGSGDEQEGGSGGHGHRHGGLREGRERTRDRIFNAMINRTEDDVEDEEYATMGINPYLGREKAGGGNRGKRAKMGKLIVWDEGLKMLDLVVAANVGVWWNVWERKAGTGTGLDEEGRFSDEWN